MTTPPRETAKELGPDAVSGSWLRFLDVHEPLRSVPVRVNGYRYWPAPEP